jgi:hypothetical protein
LHWLIHQGHVIEFANGILETAKKPAPRPPKPEKPKKEGAAPTEGAAEAHPESHGEVTSEAGVVAGEGTHAETEGGAGESSAAAAEPSAALTETPGAGADAIPPAQADQPAASEEPKEHSPA